MVTQWNQSILSLFLTINTLQLTSFSYIPNQLKISLSYISSSRIKINMASTSTTVVGFLVTSLMAMSWNGVSAQSGCTTALTSLAPCLNYVAGNSSTPSSSCCSQLAFVVQSTPICLCSLLNGTGPSFGLTINQTQALQLPGACNVKTPPVGQCNGKILVELYIG